MEIQTASLPSGGYKSQIPAVFEMRMFGGAEMRFISKAVETKELRHILIDALAPCLSVPLEEFTIQDAHALVFQQRMFMNSVAPLRTYWRCNKPLFEYSDGISKHIRPEGGAINTFPCAANNVGVIDESSMTISRLVAEHDTFDLARMRHYDKAVVDMFNWHAAHMGPNFDRNVARLEEQTDLTLWTELSEWVRASVHGVRTEIELTCPSCQRASDRQWEMTPAIFIS